ncbi:hypothetical protein AVEN_81112-1 [Araneus ventricosus]|uniref:MADF domain-containing protein n=1 Tax=Araneus ventricosus TaxID=182803 RepID=A0A4Y2DUZ9_ARAVE|nr:hypothetical protein AVEN_81112-1 [Araneus ventricosus]
MEKGDIDNKKLIQEVNKYPSLWDQRSLDYLSRNLKIREWALVALEMNCSVDEVKSQWKTLKYTFLRELRSTAKSGQPSKWNHFDSMSFLLQGFNTLLLPSPYSSQNLPEFNSPYISSVACDNEFSENSSVACPEEDPESSQSKKLKINPKDGAEILTSTPYQSNLPFQFNGLRPEDNNEDYYFLMSLLPSFERMPAQQKMFLKIKIMQDVYNASYGGSMPNLDTSSSSGIDTGSSEFTFSS